MEKLEARKITVKGLATELPLARPFTVILREFSNGVLMLFPQNLEGEMPPSFLQMTSLVGSERIQRESILR